jgi:hypothetical protein
MSDLDGRIISKSWPVDGKNRACRAVVKYMGKRAEPYAYKITYELDGDTETMTRQEVEKHLLKLKGASSSAATPAKKERKVKKEKDIKTEAIDEEYWDAEEAAACDGITIMKRWPVPGSKGKTKLYPGKVTYLGEKERPYCFKVKYEDDKETMCLAEVVSFKKEDLSASAEPKSTTKATKAGKKTADKPLAVKKAQMKKSAVKK